MERPPGLTRKRRNDDRDDKETRRSSPFDPQSSRSRLSEGLSQDLAAVHLTSGAHDIQAIQTVPSTPNISADIPPVEVRPYLAEVPLSLSDKDRDLVDLQKFPVPLGGGFCDMHIGFHRPTGIKLAMKRPRHSHNDGDVIRRFRREAATWSQLVHVNILPFFGIMEIEGSLCLISPWMSLGDLNSFVKDHERHITEQKLEEGSADESLHRFHSSFREFKTIREIAAGIEFLHSRGTIHGDIKGKNVVLDDDGCAKICDFGLTKATFRDATSMGLKGFGSLRWQSPELLDEKPKSFESDIYAFGMTIAEVLTANLPMPHLEDSRFFKAILIRHERPTQIPMSRLGTPFGPLWSLASECWVTNPSERPTITKVLERLDKTPLLAKTRGSELVDLSNAPVRLCDGFSQLSTGVYRLSGCKLAMKGLKLRTHDLVKALNGSAVKWSTLVHINVLPFFGMMEIEDRIYIASEWMEGGDLLQFARSRINCHEDFKKHGTAYPHKTGLIERDAVHQLAAGIEYLHSVGFVHGNIKARNVLISLKGKVRLGDYGLSEARRHYAGTLRAHDTPSLRWRAPELLLLDKPESTESDVYAFAMTIVELLTGKHPLPDLENSAFRIGVIEFDSRPKFDPVLRFENIDFRPLWQLASECWKRKPAERPTMKEIVRKCGLRPYRPQIYLQETGSDLVDKAGYPPVTGTFYKVYAKVHGPSKLELAIKCLQRGHSSSSDVHNLAKVANQWRPLDHDNILPFYGTLTISNEIHLIFQWMELGDLWSFVVDRSKHITNGIPQNPSLDSVYSTFRETRVIYEIATGIEYLHALGILHNNICAGNILLDRNGCAKIGSIGGTDLLRDKCVGCVGIFDDPIRWKSPELLSGGSESKASDVYAFAMTIVEILTCTHPPLPLIEDVDLSNDDQEQNAPPIFQPESRLSIDFEPLWSQAAQCWRAEPSERPSMKEVKDFLKNLDSIEYQNWLSEKEL